MGMHKWEQLNLKYQLKDTPTPTKEEIEKVRNIFRSFGYFVT